MASPKVVGLSPLALIGGSGCGLTHAGPGFFRTSRPTGERDGFQLLRPRVPYEYPVGLDFLVLKLSSPTLRPSFRYTVVKPT